MEDSAALGCISREEHLFISYAGEDGHFASWLATSLSRRGYLVWIDKHKLLGGESFPRDIEVAIDKRSFRVLALMSKASVDKPNPRKERVLAEKKSKKSGIEDFLIPIRVDDISPDDFDLSTTDRSAIDFSGNWAVGLEALLKKLKTINCPVSKVKSQEALRKLATEQDLAISGPEKIISNFLPIHKLPKNLFGYQIDKRKLPIGRRVSYRKDKTIWFLEPLKAKGGKTIKPNFTVKASSKSPTNGIVPRFILKNLLEKSIVQYCKRKGLNAHDDDLYFPLDLLEKNTIKYTSLNGRRTRTSVSGLITASYTNDKKNQFRYFIVPTFWVILDRFKNPVLRIGIRIRNTDLSERPFPVKTAFRKRKKTTKSWRNKQWLGKHLGIAYWLTEGKTLSLFSGNQSFEIGGEFISICSSKGIDEEKIGAPPIEDVFGDFDQGVEDV